MIVDVPRLLAKLGIVGYRAVRAELWASCPMPGHEERKASWSIVSDPTSERNGYHRCFGCKRGGGPASLVAEVIGITEQSARQWIVDNGCAVDDQTPDTLPGRVRCRVDPPPVEVALELPTGVTTGPWNTFPRTVRRYLAERGITSWQVAAYGIGYAEEGVQRGRVVFPIRDRYGALLSYTGRSHTGSRLRYRSADRQPGARPSSALFGEALWGERSGDECFAAEGAIKVLAVERALCSLGTGETGPAIAAFCGAELHEEQCLKLRRFDRITYVADSNETGRRFAAELEAKLCGMSAVRVVVTPPGLDADDLTRDELRSLLG